MPELDIPRIKRNIGKMIDRGAPEAEIDAYVSSEGTTAEALRSAPAAPLEQLGPPQPPAPPLYHGTEPQAINAVPQPEFPIARSATQGVGRGLVNLPLMLPDLAAAGANLGIAGGNLGLAGLDWAAGTGSIPWRLPSFPSPSDTAADIISRNLPPEATVEPEKLGFLPHVAYNVGRMGTEALGGAAALARMAARRAATTTVPVVRPGHAPPVGAPPSQSPRWYDPLVQPYEAGRVGKTIAGDVAAATGSGVAVTGAERNAPDSAFAKTLASLGGGVGGMSALEIAKSPQTLLQRVLSGLPEKAISRDPLTGAATSKRTAEHTARLVQGLATDPAAAAQTMRARTAEAQAIGAPPPTAGLGSNDIGMIAMERGARLKEPVPFSERDQQIADFVQRSVTGLRDPAADQGAVTTFAKERPEQLATARDATALPLLRQAEASGARIDAQPVADLIDQQLQTAKRPPVVTALKDARTRLNKVGSDQLDDSVSGLYETRKAINDIIEGRTETPTGRFAVKELIAVRNELDKAITGVVPEFKQYLDIYKTGSQPLDVLKESPAFTQLTQEDPRNVAKKLLSGQDYGAAEQFKMINRETAGDPQAQRAWRAAVAEVLVDKATTTNTALTGGSREGPVSLAQLQRVFKANEPALAELYGPRGMQKLRQAHKMLEPFGNLARRAVTGSQTEENRQLTNAMEAGILAYTGNAVKTGMIMRRLRVAANLIPGLKNFTLESKINRLAARMFFDPDLFDHLMTKPISVDTPTWNRKLNQLLGAAEGAREFNNTE